MKYHVSGKYIEIPDRVISLYKYCPMPRPEFTIAKPQSFCCFDARLDLVEIAMVTLSSSVFSEFGCFRAGR
jgi:hypothetical protein